MFILTFQGSVSDVLGHRPSQCDIKLQCLICQYSLQTSRELKKPWSKPRLERSVPLCFFDLVDRTGDPVEGCLETLVTRLELGVLLCVQGRTLHRDLMVLFEGRETSLS